MIDDLKKLLQNWAFRVGRKDSAPAFSENCILPDWVLEKITNRSSYRAQAIEDAKIYWSFPLPVGFGMKLRLPKNIEIVPFESWSETIYKFEAKMEYCERMDGLHFDLYPVNIERIAIENGEWRFVEIYSETEREQIKRFSEHFKKFRTEKS